MKAILSTSGILVFLSLLMGTIQAQDAQTSALLHSNQQQNPIYTNLKAGNWSFGLGAGASVGTRRSEPALFRGNDFATKMFAGYHLGNIGLSATSGLASGRISNRSINQFTKERGLPQDKLSITTSNAFNGYLLVGPSFRFGKKLFLNADLQGGLFVNNPGTVQIIQEGNIRPVYQFSNGDKTLFPGFSGSLSVNYPMNTSTHFFINGDYLQSKTSVRLLDPKNGIDNASLISRKVQWMMFGVGIVKSFGSPGKKNSGKNHPGKPHYGNAYRSAAENCGPVTYSTTKADGSVEQLTFACPEDAALFMQRHNADVGKSRQTQGLTFGEAVSNGMQSSGLDSNRAVTEASGDEMERKGWDGSVKGNSITARAMQDSSTRKKSIQTWGDPHENLNGKHADSPERKGWDGSVKGNSITARVMQDSSTRKKSIQTWGDPHENLNGKQADSPERKGWDGSVKGNSIIKENSSNTGTGRDLTSSREQSIAENAVTVTDIDGDGLADRSILSVKGIVADINRLTKGRVPGIAVSLSNKGINEAGIKYTGDADNKVIEKATSGLKDNIRTNVRVTGTTPPLWEAPEMKQTDHWGDPHENVNGKQGIPNKTENEALSKGQRSSSPLSSKIIRVPDGDMLVLSAHPDRYPGNLKEMPATEPVRGAAIWFEGEDGKVYKKITDNQGVVNLMDLPVGQTLSLSVNLMLSGEEDIMIHFPASNSNQNVAARVLKTKHDTVKNSINNIR